MAFINKNIIPKTDEEIAKGMSDNFLFVRYVQEHNCYPTDPPCKCTFCEEYRNRKNLTNSSS